MNQRELEDLLRALHQLRAEAGQIQSPQDTDATGRDAYFRNTAELVMKQLRLSGWTLEPPQVIRKAPSKKYG